MRLTALAPAKINLFLHVGPVDAAGYHPLESLVAFADIGDGVTVEPSNRLTLEVAGPFAEGLAGDDNLIVRAVRALGEAAGVGEPPLRIVLDKRLPIAAGLGGGSSDAGAALRLAARVLSLNMNETRLERIADVVGADGPMCLRARTAWAGGRGEALTDEPRLPSLPVVLLNPRLPSPTGAVYRAYDANPAAEADRPAAPDDWSRSAVIDWLARQRNDLEAPALSLTSGTGQALEAMRAAPNVRLARMSGSGATVFGLFDTAEDAERAAQWLCVSHPAWWTEAGLLNAEAV
ncbi:4-(cytidine 5'-diphospho)-2-C-methyl-D-erythritol kinase [Brevundimonas sp. PAMC22021]|uniref:4-(cytidine 5'-diphospho)-2-C-methyl-D-erythritol kinase n=1 Tax=Brevundimonas sp. PAMC22021 TaxID=2861285 RepID=UPI001C624D9B|nr:4-(cytidine 5'-diphospho)-2-C-methyl-D-erythritol kinase [Brevundimonas sp. PAMC22021]QYF86362.1 4-(cytidine 5'-diphospho)-2-C-methyl-D-erythritol kinase [Brevundimonas sp. PAMC22021]